METPSSGTATPVDVENGFGNIRKRLTVTFRDLNVRVTAPDAALGSTMWSDVDPRQLGSLFHRTKVAKRVRKAREKDENKMTIIMVTIDNFERRFWSSETRRDGKHQVDCSTSMLRANK